MYKIQVLTSDDMECKETDLVAHRILMFDFLQFV